MRPKADARSLRAAHLLLVRGVLALSLGAALLVTGGQSRRSLLGFMGIYWLLSGIVTLRFVALLPRPRSRRAVFAGVVGLSAGIITLVARVFFPDETQTLVIALLGLVIMLTGVAHLTGGFELEPGGRWHPGIPMGILEVLLGGILMVYPAEHGKAVVVLAGAWLLFGGAVLFGDGLRLRRQELLARPLEEEDESS